MCQQFRLQVTTQIEALDQVLRWFETKIKPLLPERCGWESKLAIAEGFTNTVHYAHQNLPPATPIELEVQVSPHQLEIKIWDFGDPFDIAAKLASIQTNNRDPLEKESERGLFLMNALTDELNYLRIAEQNCLVMRKEF